MYIYADPASNVMGKRKTKEQHDKATLPEIYDYDKVLAALSAFTTLCFIVVSPWVVLRGTQSLRRISAWVASAAFLFNAHWYIRLTPNGWISGLGIGYFLWWLSFAVLAIGLFDLAGRNDATESKQRQAALLPR